MYRFSALLLAQLALAQTQFDAFVKIIDQDLAGQLGTYRFTIDLTQGQSIQVTLPHSINYEGTSQTKVDVCRQYLASSTVDLPNCLYDQSKNIITFPLPTIDPGFFVFDLGPIRNPYYSQLLSGFLIEILDNSNTVISASNPFAVFVNIQPNFLTSQSLTVDSLKVAAITNYHFSFTTTNPVPAGGFIEIVFPQTQIQVPQTAPVTQLTVLGSQQQTLYATSTSSSSLTFRIDSGIPALTNAKLLMNQVNNPNTISETSSFTLRTLTASGKIIDQVQTGLTVKASQPAEISVDQMSVSQKRVGASTSITFKITLPTTYSQGGSLTVNLPDTVTVDGTKLSCLLFIGFSQDQGYCNMPSASKINLYAPINQPSLTFAISGFVNPPNTKPTLSFTFQAFDPQGNVIMQSINGQYYGYTPTVGTIQTPSITRQILSVGSPTAVTIVFKTQNNVKTGEFAVVNIPKSQFLIANGLPTCSSKTQYDSQLLLTTCTLAQTASDFTVTFAVNCSASSVGYCTAGITISLQISSGLQNLNWIAASSTSASITTMTSDMVYQIDQVASGIFSQPALIPGMITSTQMVKQLGVVGQETSVQVKATLTNMIPASGTFQIVLPDNSLQEPLSILICTSSLQVVSCTYTKYVSGYVNTISVSNPCGVQCSIGQTVDITLAHLRNPKSVKPITNSFTIATYTAENYAIDSGVITNASGLDVSVAPIIFTQVQAPSPSSQITTGALMSYAIAITPTNGIQPTTGKLVLAFPPEIFISSVTTCVAYQDVTMVLLSCVVSGQQFIVTHSIGGQTFQASQLIVQGAKIKNPPSTKPSDFIKVQSYLTVGSTAYLVDQDLTTLLITSNTPNQLISAQVNRSNAIVTHLADLQVCLKPFNPIPANSVMMISIPTDQAVFGGTVTTSITLVSVANQVLTLVMPQIAAGVQSCFTIFGVLNPNTTKPSVQSITVNLQTSDGYKIDAEQTGVFAQPYLSAGPFQSLDVRSSNSIVGQLTTLTVQIGLQSSLAPGNLIYLGLPPSIYYLTQSLQCQLQAGSAASCQSSTASDAIGTYYNSIAYLVSESYSQGQLVVLKITGVMNKFSTMPFSGQILVQSLDSAGYTVNSSTQTLALAYVVNQNASLVATRTNQVVQKATSLQLLIKLSTRLQSGSDLTVTIPDTVLTNPVSVKVNLAGQLVFSTITRVTNNGVMWYAVKISLAQQYADSSTLQLEIVGFKNRYSTQPTVEGISAKTSLSDFDIDVTSQTQITGDLTPTSVTISSPKLSVTIVGQQTDFSFSLLIDGVAKTGNSVTIKFPGQVVYFSTSTTVFIGNSFINSQIQQDQSGYLLRIDFVLPSDVTSSIVVTIKNVQNLNQVKPLNFSFTTTIMDQSSLVAAGQTDLDSLYLLQPATLAKVNLVRASQTLSLLTELLVGFELPTNYIMPQSTIQVLIPTSEFTLTGQCYANTQATCVTQPFNNDMIRIVVSNVCSMGCPTGQRIGITLSGAVINSSKATLTLVQSQIVLQNNGYQIGIAQGQVTPGLQVPGVSGLQVSQDVAITGQVIKNLIFGFNLQYDQPGATKININFPSYSFIYNQTTCFFVKNGIAKEIYCTAQQQAPQLGLPSMALSVYMEELGGLLDSSSLNQVCISGLRNIDYVRERDSTNSFTVSLLSENNQIIVQSSVNELLLPKLEQATLNQLSFTRKSSKIGELGVNYLLSIKMPTYLRLGGYIVITIPKLQAIVNGNSISCQDIVTLSSLNCQLRLVNGDQVVKVTNWCPNGLCQPGSQIKLAMALDNPSQMFQGNANITVSIFTKLDQPVAASIGINMLPQLVGVSLQGVTLSRKVNLLGQMDTLKLFIPDIGQSIITQTDLILVLPDGISTNQTPSCTRILRQVKSQIACEILDTFDSGSIKRVIFHSVCDQQYICLLMDNLELWISGGQNPSTNTPIGDQSASIYLKTPQGQDVGFASFTASLATMNPSVLQISSTVNNCTTLLVCPMTVALRLSNPLLKNGYVVFTSPVNFTAYECQVGSDFTCQVLTTNTVKIIANADALNLVTVSVAYVQMPASTEPSGDFKATSFENLGGGKVMILDQGSGGGLTLTPSRFRQFDVSRTSNLIGEVTGLQFTFTTYVGRENDLLVIQIPLSSGLLNQSACSRKNVTIACQVSGQTISISKVGSVCKTSSLTQLACRFLVSNVKNPDYFIIQNESSVTVQLLTSNKFQVQLQTDGIIATPALAPLSLEITMPYITPDSSITAQSGITINFHVKLPVTTAKYLMVEFDQTSYVPYASLYSSVTVTVNQDTAPLVAISVGDIKGIFFPIKSLTIALPLNQQDFSVQISGLTNPMFTNEGNLLNCNMTVSSAISIVRYLARSSIDFNVKLVASRITPISAYLVSPFISQTTYLDIVFNLDSFVQQGNVQIVFPSDFRIGAVPKLSRELSKVGSVECSDLASGLQLRCTVSGQTISVQFNQTAGPYNAFTLKVGPIINPRVANNYTASVQVQNQASIFGSGNFVLSTNLQGNNCTDCSTCTKNGQCVSCLFDLILSNGLCVQTCPQGSYELDGRCFACVGNCAQCQRQDMCSVCKTGKRVAGMCSADCPIGFTQNDTSCQLDPGYDGNPWVDTNSTASKIFGRANLNDTKNMTTPRIFEMGVCKMNGCNSCSINPDHCEQCTKGFIIADGRCLQHCPIGMFEALGECFKCNSACSTCETNANTCLSCKTESLFVTGYGMCVRNRCPGGTYKFRNGTQCGMCNKQCNTCDDSITCSSCFTDFTTGKDMFFTKGTCSESCPFLSSQNIETHICEVLGVENSQYLPMIIPIIALLTTLGAYFISKKKSAGAHEPYGIAIAFLTQFEVFNWVILAGMLWPTTETAQFVVVGVVLMANSGLGIYTRWALELKVATPLSIVSQITGPNTLRLSFSNFCGLKSEQTDPNSIMQLEKICIAQAGLVLAQSIAGLVLPFQFGPQDPQFGLGLNCAVIGLTQIGLQVKLNRQINESMQVYSRVNNN